MLLSLRSLLAHPGLISQRSIHQVLACGFLGSALSLALGCSPDKQEPSGPANSGAAAAAPVQSTLTPEQVSRQWEREHIAFALERRWARRWIAALEETDDATLARTFLAEPKITKPVHEMVSQATSWGEHSVLAANSDNLADASSLDVAGWIALWREMRSRFVERPEIDFTIESIQDLAPATGDSGNQSRWQVTANWHWRGQTRNDAGVSQVHASIVKSSIEFLIDDPTQVDVNPVVQAWHLRGLETVESPRPWFEDMTEPMRFDALALPDNRTATPEKIRQYRFQLALEDFDLDGRIDLAMADPDGPPVLLRHHETGHLRQVAYERGIIVERAQGQLLCTWFDMDGDRDPDLIMGSLVLRNDKGLFVDITASSGIVIDPYCMSALPADYDLDGDIDLYFVYQRGTGPSVKLPTSWVDGEGTGRANELWRNDGNGEFSDVTAETGAGGGARISNAATWVLLDEDRYPDLYIANEFSRDVVLRNRGDGTFEDVTQAWGAESFGLSMGVVTGDVDHDGRNDVVVSRPFSVAGARIVDALDPNAHNPKVRQRLEALVSGSALLRSQTVGFQPQSLGRQLPLTGWSFAPLLADLDGDSHLDLAFTNGLASFSTDRPDGASNFWQMIAAFPENRDARLVAPGELDTVAGEFWAEQPLRMTADRRNLASYERNFLAAGDGQGGFYDVSGISGLDAEFESRTVVSADLDRDGHLDLFVGSVGGTPLQLLRNTLTDSNWIGIELHGNPSNAYGLGSRVKLKLGDRTIVRDLLQLSTFLGAGPAELTIGIGDATAIDAITVEWPSGKTTTVTGLQTNRRWRLFEDETAPRELPRPTFSELFSKP